MRMNTFVCDHYVVIVSVSYAQYIGGHAVAGAGLDKPLHCLEVL